MKPTKKLAAAALIMCFTATVSFAAVESSSLSDSGKAPQQTAGKEIRGKKDIRGKDFWHKWDGTEQKDPVKMLENMKKELQTKVRNGEITKEKAEAITGKINAKIKEIKEFDKLTLPEKKSKLTSSFKSFIEEKVKSGKLTREKADELLKKHTERIKEWDGTGYPMLRGKGLKLHKNDAERGKE
jgi:hypothetical protein